jgi:RDD family
MEDQLQDLPIGENPAPGWKKSLAGLIDAALVIISYLASSILEAVPANATLPIAKISLTIMLIFVIYRILFIVILGKTVGMIIFQIRFLTGNEEKLNVWERLMASLFILINGIDYYTENNLKK